MDQRLCFCRFADDKGKTVYGPQTEQFQLARLNRGLAFRIAALCNQDCGTGFRANDPALL